MRANWTYFAAKWGYPPAYPESGYDPRSGYFSGFNRALHYAALPKPKLEVTGEERPSDRSERAADVRFVAEFSGGDAAWEPIGRFMRRYLRAFRSVDPVVLTLRLGEGGDAAAVERRIEKILASLDISPEICADVEVLDLDEEPEVAVRTLAIADLPNTSPSSLRRLIEVEKP